MSRLDNFEEILNSYEGRKIEKDLLGINKKDYDALVKILEPAGKTPEDIYDPIKNVVDRIKVENGRVTMLDLSSLGLERLADEVGELDSLDTLECDHNELKILPESISKLHFLGNLFIQSNPIICLPEGLLKLPNLRYILCADTAIRNDDLVASILEEQGVNISKE